MLNAFCMLMFKIQVLDLVLPVNAVISHQISIAVKVIADAIPEIILVRETLVHICYS